MMCPIFLYSGYFLLFLFFFSEDVNSDQCGNNRRKYEDLAKNAADRVIEDIVDLGNGDFRALGSMYIDTFLEYFNLPPEPEDPDISTLSGFAAHNLEKIPDENDSFEYKNLIITVTKTDSNRVLEAKVHVNEIVDTTEEADE